MSSSLSGSVPSQVLVKIPPYIRQLWFNFCNKRDEQITIDITKFNKSNEYRQFKQSLTVTVMNEDNSYVALDFICSVFHNVQYIRIINGFKFSKNTFPDLLGLLRNKTIFKNLNVIKIEVTNDETFFHMIREHLTGQVVSEFEQIYWSVAYIDNESDDEDEEAYQYQIFRNKYVVLIRDQEENQTSSGGFTATSSGGFSPTLTAHAAISMKRHLNDLWHKTMLWMGQQQVFQQQSYVLNRLKSYDFVYILDHYNIVLQEMLKIYQRKAHIHSEEVLARNFIKQFGFIVPQSVEIEDVYENIIQIYRKIEEIEKHKMSKKANQFIHILDDFKYNDDFQNNEDNIIGDFKPKTIDYTPNLKVYEDTMCLQKPCQSIERMVLSLSYLVSLDIQKEMDQNRIVQYCIEHHPALLDDYIHITTEHKKGCENDHKHSYSSGHSLFEKNQILTPQTDNTTSGNDDFEFLKDILDATHRYLYHSDDIVDDIRTQTHKYNLSNYKNKTNESALEALCRYMLDDPRVSKDAIDRLFSEIISQEYDSDTFIHDVYRKDVSSSHLGIVSPDQYDVVFEFVRRMIDRESSFNIGLRFYYWKHYKHALDEEREYFQNKNDHSGYQPHELYVETKYASLKEEILQNMTCRLNPSKYSKMLNKAEKYMRSAKVRTFKAVENQLLHYGIWDGTPLFVDNLLCVIFYCDETDLCTAFSATFRNNRCYESIESVKNRNKEFANWSRILRETVELFGMQGWEKRDKDEKKWNNDHNRTHGPFYCGMKGLIVMPEFSIRLCGPTSVSAQIEIAWKFAGTKGIVITLNNNGHWHSDHLRIWDCSWLSKHRREDERLLLGGLYTIRIQGVRTIGKEGANFESYFQPLFYFDCMVTGISVRKHEPTITEMHLKHLHHLKDSHLNLIRCKRDDDEYIHHTFRTYLHHRKQIIINLHYVYKYFEKLKSFIIHESDSCKTWDCACNFNGNSINNTRCTFCGRPAPQDTCGMNNMLKTDLFRLFDDVDHVIIYATSGDGQQEYAFDVNHLLLQNLHMLMKRDGKIKIKATHQYKDGKHDGVSWLSKAWDKNESILKTTAKSMNLNILLTHTENRGAQVLLEDTLTIIESEKDVYIDARDAFSKRYWY
eukprot:829913_1